ncbi:DUF4175 domain-containing protein [Hymenobacter weizhouensis]|uniref:DUF4175 domain-containing protein n=1 Tax=Hymenobacter sp. YIM 151500-1 TaxID=2987689 RepID=UPI002227ECDE|nr:DUF4175 domain-containing protein [Hymenobacter sp. YIM 151500-1]UYZ62019.1 DUF4175 domain-containing protein [Hymenobacter sp. YIM 151500-1]
MSLLLTAPAAVSEAAPLLRTLHRAWLGRRAVALLLPALAALALLLALGTGWPLLRGPVAGATVLWLGVVGWQLRRLLRASPADLTRHLDRLYPALEDSAGLLLPAPVEPNLLVQLQQQRVLSRLRELRATTRPLLPVPLRGPLLLSAALLALAAGAWGLRPAAGGPAGRAEEKPVQLRFSETPALPPAAPRILATRLLVTPPAYTRRAAFSPAEPSFRCPQGSRVRWTVQVSRPTTAAPVLELGGRRVLLRATGQGPSREFAAEATLTASALYRVRLGGQVSEEYAIEVQPDHAPTVQIISPKAYTLAEFGRPPQVAVQVRLRDDYGLSRARLVATVAQGQGEAVKFREVVTDLSAPLSGQPATASLRHVLRLPNLGLTYGDEVYFYVQAWDNRRQLTRSDTYLVQWEDTTVQESALDASLGVNTTPAYFRSQRQIIIDTEKLLTEQPRLDQATLLDRSNSIGFDQKVLRLRYGKFLGEEFEESIGAATRPPVAEAPADEDAGLGSVVAEDHTAATDHDEHHGHDHPPGQHPADDHGHAHTPPPADAPPGAAAAAELMEPYIHRHDDSETADFLEPAVKAKLRAVLSEMWEAELRLRTGRPREALPYEYRALRLLKQVQQQTRAYVKKAGFTPPPMPEATTRLTGDLAGAAAPRRQATTSAPPQQPTVRAALRALQQLRSGQPAPTGTAATLDQAGQELARAALQKPGAYLTALRELRRLSSALRAGTPPPLAAVPIVERALTDLLPPPRSAPSRPPAAPTRLAQRYFQELSQ